MYLSIEVDNLTIDCWQLMNEYQVKSNTISVNLYFAYNIVLDIKRNVAN